jgi:transcriptional regulator GlxA family with amidase domain
VAVEPELTDSLVLTMKEYLDANWFDAIDLGSYAKSLGVSLKTASRRFKKAVGMSLKQYQQTKRIDEAKVLLTTTTWSLKDIGYECGFYDLPQFSRLFKASVGQAPSQYRKERADKLSQEVSVPVSIGVEQIVVFK